MDSVARVGIIMGSQSDWATMTHAAGALEALGVAHETRIVSAHRTPDRLADYARSARGRVDCSGTPDRQRPDRDARRHLDDGEQAVHALERLAPSDHALAERLDAWRAAQTEAVAEAPAAS